MNLSSKLRFNLQNIKQNAPQFPSIKFPAKYKGTVIEKWANYWKQLLIDYKEVIIDTTKTVKEKPIKSVFAGTIFGSIYYLNKENPTMEKFLEQLTKYNNEFILVNEVCHNKTSADYLIFIERCANAGILKRISFGVGSVLWIDNYNSALGIYKAICPFLQPEYSKMHERIIDVGFLNNWWNLGDKMKDYDVLES